MPALFFPNSDTLRLILSSGIVDPVITRQPTRATSDGHGRVWIELAELPPRDSVFTLTRLGVQTLGDTSDLVERIGSWAELLPLRQIKRESLESIAALRRRTLFEVPDSRVAAFHLRLRRATTSPVSVQLVAEQGSTKAWVVVDDPPIGLLLCCLEHDSGIDTYFEQSVGVWVRVGWEHPLPDQLVVPADHVALLDPPRTLRFRSGQLPIPDFDEFVIPRRKVIVRRATVGARIPIALRIARTKSAIPETLWVFDGPDRERFWDFCRSADQRVLNHYEAALTERAGATRLVVRAISGKPTAALPLVVAAYHADPRVAGLYIPVGRELRPTIRVNELARVLNLDPGRLTWVEVGDEGEVVPHSVPRSEFRPLPDQLEYTAPRTVEFAPRKLSPEPFGFDRFIPIAGRDELAGPASIKDDWVPEPVDLREKPDVRPGWLARSIARLVDRLRRQDQATPTAPPVTESPVVAPRPPTPRRKRLQAATPERVEQQLASAEALVHGADRTLRRRELEAQLLDEFPRLTQQQRAERWAELGAVYGATGNPRDAALCWINAIWESASPPVVWLEQWLLAESRIAKQTSPQVKLDRWLSEPGRFGVGRVVAAYSAWAAHQSPPRSDLLTALPQVLSFLDQHFDDLPARAAWLARLAVTRLCDGDALGLARWRDRILARLRDRGPGLDLDEPSFLRFHGTAEPERFQTAQDWLVRTREPILAWVNRLGSTGRLQFAGIDPEIDCTAGYAQLMLAWGLGQLGERTRSLDWAARARKLLTRTAGPQVDPAVHLLLVDLFHHRIRDAQEGRSARPGLPGELQTRYDQLTEFSRYAVDKCRRFVRILEPVNRVREYTGKEFKEFWGHDRLGERLFVLAEHPDPAYLTEETRTLLAACAAEPSSEIVPRVVFTLLEVAPHLQASVVGALLSHVIAALDWLETWLQTGRWDETERAERLLSFQARLLENAFTTAVWFNQIAAVRPLVAHLLRHVPTDTGLRQAVTRAAGQLFRSFRKLGYRSEAEELSAILDPARGDGWPSDAPFPPSRLGLAVGWFAAGDEEAGTRILDEARDRLFLIGRGDDRDRTRLAIVYAEALGFAPPRIALGRLGEIFQRLDRITVTGSTNRYFTLKPLELIDTVIRSVVTEEFSLGPAVRGWLDDDEFLIRRRIHRDLATVLRDDGIA